ncbi:MAG TPA: hypothetical protein VLC95_04585 [Anaerolineae bacterium]|nr:hypothetical protein [Anaerolineae bacterium]
MLKRPSRYHSYLLRFWQDCVTPAAPIWRFSLEDPLTGRRQGFASLESFLIYLQAEMDVDVSRHESEGEGA